MSRHVQPSMSWHQRIVQGAFWTAVAGAILFAPVILGDALGNWLIAEFL